MHTATQVEALVKDAIRRQLHTHELLDARTRFDDLGADSLAVVELTLVFEEMFDIDIADEEAARIRTVRDAIVAVERHLHASRNGED